MHPNCVDNPYKEQIEQCFLVAMPTAQLGSYSVIALVFSYFIHFYHREKTSQSVHIHFKACERDFAPPQDALLTNHIWHNNPTGCAF